MAIRYLKILLVIFGALLCLLYATHNLVSLQAAFQYTMRLGLVLLFVNMYDT
ncbi:hypothetical protein [Thioalkalivibrio sp. XN8]|uniref:hypothetical protein n=1 Tax=Thioalkalivibrio sp. XN8 TaxID=2712863 RepID=UPI0013EDA409|nr:hypothetical protein [Thioalkalivibrio sp. XN8]NGP52019.1 hypothetical protein [Thioalkalivibrio sp. XN8]